MPIGAEDLMKKYNISKGKQLGTKLKLIEDEWVKIILIFLKNK